MSISLSNKSYRKYKAAWMENKANTFYLEMVLTFGIIIFFGWFALRPTFITISELLGDRESLDEVNALLDEKIDALAAAQLVYEEAEPKLELLSQAIPEDPRITEFLAQVEILAIEKEVTLITTKYSEFPLIEERPVEQEKTKSKRNTPDQLPWNQVAFEINVSGTFEEIEAFSVALIQMRRLSLVDNISLKIADDTETIEEPLEMKLDGRILFY